ncbi:hypothetical protein TRAPUB_1592 [Trametes pubescens]|uniref:Uncharacterized protein n=1 Tax=Trametes pubescens TaxID=154538 RepID=A0A1M2VJ18_TRAPU|nr:hypothetical protein TRAPUB_1592 [Trametes pubescens]
MLKREGKRSRMTKVFAPPSPQHPNQRKSLRPKISIRWEDSPEEHPLKSSFIWAGDPGEAIDLTALDTLEKEEAVVAPFPQYCHLDLPELWKLHHWWRHSAFIYLASEESTFA